MQEFKYHIFDFDGVIKDSINIKEDAFVELFVNERDDFKDYVKRYHRLNGGKSRYLKIEHYLNILNIDFKKSDIDSLANQFSNIVLDKVIKSNYIEGAFEYLRDISKDKKCFLITGTPTHEIRVICNKLNLTFFFDEILGSPESKESHIQFLFSKYGDNLNEYCFYGDSSTDLNACKAKCIKFIGINPDHSIIKFSKNEDMFSDFEKFLKNEKI